MQYTLQRKTEEQFMAMAADSSTIHFTYNNMIYTLILVTLDALILNYNQQKTLALHSLLIIYFLFVLNRTKQPPHYTLNPENLAKYQKRVIFAKQIDAQILKRICQICQAIKGHRYAHCRKCNICLYRMDHHCEWIGNCVAQFNSKIYLHFLLHIFIHSISVVFLFLTNYQHLMSGDRAQCFYWFNGLPGLYAAYESFRLGRDFHTSIEKNQTLIESFKKVTGYPISYSQNLKAYLGRTPLSWFLPFFCQQQNFDLLERTISEGDQQQPDAVYADEHMYGHDEDDQLFTQNQKET